MQLSATKLFWVLIQPCNEKNHHALEKVEIAQNKKPLVFSEVMAFLQEYSHTSLRMYGFFIMLELKFQDMDKGSKCFEFKLY